MAELLTLLCNSSVPVLEQLSLDPPDSAFRSMDHASETKQRVSIMRDDVFLYSTWMKGKRNGRASVRDNNDTLLMSMRFVNDLLEGTMILCDATCQLSVVYSRGVPTGEVKVLKDMEIEFQGVFQNGRANGKGTQYLPNGKRFCGNYVNGVASGMGSLISESGSTLLQGMWINGRCDSIPIHYQRIVAFIHSQSLPSVVPDPDPVIPTVPENTSGLNTICDYYQCRTNLLIFEEEAIVLSKNNTETENYFFWKEQMNEYVAWLSLVVKYNKVQESIVQKYMAIRKAIGQTQREEVIRVRPVTGVKKQQENWKENEPVTVTKKAASVTKKAASVPKQATPVTKNKQKNTPSANQMSDSDSSSEEMGEEMGRERGKLKEMLEEQRVQYDDTYDESIATLEVCTETVRTPPYKKRAR